VSDTLARDSRLDCSESKWPDVQRLKIGEVPDRRRNVSFEAVIIQLPESKQTVVNVRMSPWHSSTPL